MSLHQLPDDILPLYTEREITERYLKALEARQQLRAIEWRLSRAYKLMARGGMGMEERAELSAQCHAMRMERDHLRTHARCAILLLDCATMQEEHCGPFAGRA